MHISMRKEVVGHTTGRIGLALLALVILAARGLPKHGPERQLKTA